jgi:hypothetical protein
MEHRVFHCSGCGDLVRITQCQSDRNGNRGRLMARVRVFHDVSLSVNSIYWTQCPKKACNFIRWAGPRLDRSQARLTCAPVHPTSPSKSGLVFLNPAPSGLHRVVSDGVLFDVDTDYVDSDNVPSPTLALELAQWNGAQDSVSPLTTPSLFENSTMASDSHPKSAGPIPGPCGTCEQRGLGGIAVRAFGGGRDGVGVLEKNGDVSVASASAANFLGALPRCTRQVAYVWTPTRSWNQAKVRSCLALCHWC